VPNVLLTDASGHFQMTGIQAGTTGWFRAFNPGYVEPCAAALGPVHEDLAINLVLVSQTDLTASVQSAAGFRSVSGTVVQQTETGKQPVAGALVLWSAFEDFEPATTYSSQAGRFVLCGLPVGGTVALGASVGSTHGYTDVPPGQFTDVEIVVQ
jgi:hypothetical protein